MENLPKIPFYHVDHLIAEGGTARVYWGIDLRSGYPVAIKELKISHFKNTAVLQKFRDEAIMYLYLEHPNICKLIDFVYLEETTRQMFIIMEFIEGRNLEQYLYTEIGLIPEEKALPMFLQILDPIGYLHSNRILHLDIKPNNVMLLPNGKLKIIDLGIASRMSEASYSTGFGTPAYMSSEQSEKGRVGVYSDIFSLGVMLFEMLTGHLPFTSNNPSPGKNIAEIKYKIKYEPTPPMKQYYSHIGDDLQFIVERALAKDPAARYQSCKEFANCIKDYMRKKRIR